MAPENKLLAKKLLVATGIALLVSVIPLPYSYYMALRYLVTASAIFYAFTPPDKKWLLLVALAMAVLYNPVKPVHLSKPVWVPINILSAFLAFCAADSVKR